MTVSLRVVMLSKGLKPGIDTQNSGSHACFCVVIHGVRQDFLADLIAFSWNLNEPFIQVEMVELDATH